MTFENYDSHGLPLRSCNEPRKPHRAHDWPHPQVGQAHCWGRNPLPKDAVEKYCTVGCGCGHCKDIRRGHHPRLIMCIQRWEKLSFEQRDLINDSISG